MGMNSVKLASYFIGCYRVLHKWLKDRKGKELNGWITLNDLKVARITVSHGRKFITRKVYKSMANQLRLSVKEFDDLLECPLDRKKYEAILRIKLK